MGFDCSGLKAYSGYYRDTQKLLQSASGGGASVLSAIILTWGGAYSVRAILRILGQQNMRMLIGLKIWGGSKAQSIFLL